MRIWRLPVARETSGRVLNPMSLDEDIEMEQWLGRQDELSDRYLWLMRNVGFQTLAHANGRNPTGPRGLRFMLRKRGWDWQDGRMTTLPCFGCGEVTKREDLANPHRPYCTSCT